MWQAYIWQDGLGKCLCKPESVRVLSKERKPSQWDENNGGGRGRTWLPVAVMAVLVIIIVVLAVINLRQSDLAENPQASAVSDIVEDEAVPVAVAEIDPSFDVVRISRGGTGVLAGRAEPDSLVEVLVDGKVIANVRADRNGEWVLILEEPLVPGTVEMGLRATPDGGTPKTSEELVVIAVPEPLKPQRFAEREGEGVVAVLTPRSGDGGSRIMQKPGLATPGEVGDSLVIDTIDYGAGGETVLAGRALPRSIVRIYLDNVFIDEMRASDDGRWSATTAMSLDDGEHILRIDQVITEGEVQLRVVQPFRAGIALDPALAESRVVVQPGNTLWTIARKLYGRGTRFTMIFQENSEQIVDPDLIYPGQLFRLPESQADPQSDMQPQSLSGGQAVKGVSDDGGEMHP